MSTINPMSPFFAPIQRTPRPLSPRPLSPYNHEFHISSSPTIRGPAEETTQKVLQIAKQSTSAVLADQIHFTLFESQLHSRDIAAACQTVTKMQDPYNVGKAYQTIIKHLLENSPLDPHHDQAIEIAKLIPISFQQVGSVKHIIQCLLNEGCPDQALRAIQTICLTHPSSPYASCLESIARSFLERGETNSAIDVIASLEFTSIKTDLLKRVLLQEPERVTYVVERIFANTQSWKIAEELIITFASDQYFTLMQELLDLLSDSPNKNEIIQHLAVLLLAHNKTGILNNLIPSLPPALQADLNNLIYQQKEIEDQLNREVSTAELIAWAKLQRPETLPLVVYALARFHRNDASTEIARLTDSSQLLVELARATLLYS